MICKECPISGYQERWLRGASAKIGEVLEELRGEFDFVGLEPRIYAHSKAPLDEVEFDWRVIRLLESRRIPTFAGGLMVIDLQILKELFGNQERPERSLEILSGINERILTRLGFMRSGGDLLVEDPRARFIEVEETSHGVRFDLPHLYYPMMARIEWERNHILSIASRYSRETLNRDAVYERPF